jgi:hypothetical protein
MALEVTCRDRARLALVGAARRRHPGEGREVRNIDRVVIGTAMPSALLTSSVHTVAARLGNGGCVEGTPRRPAGKLMMRICDAGDAGGRRRQVERALESWAMTFGPP